MIKTIFEFLDRSLVLGHITYLIIDILGKLFTLTLK